MSRERIVQIVQVGFTVRGGEKPNGISHILLVESAVSTWKSVYNTWFENS